MNSGFAQRHLWNNGFCFNPNSFVENKGFKTLLSFKLRIFECYHPVRLFHFLSFSYHPSFKRAPVLETLAFQSMQIANVFDLFRHKFSLREFKFMQSEKFHSLEENRMNLRSSREKQKVDNLIHGRLIIKSIIDCCWVNKPLGERWFYLSRPYLSFCSNSGLRLRT